MFLSHMYTAPYTPTVRGHNASMYTSNVRHTNMFWEKTCLLTEHKVKLNTFECNICFVITNQYGMQQFQPF